MKRLILIILINILAINLIAQQPGSWESGSYIQNRELARDIALGSNAQPPSSQELASLETPNTSFAVPSLPTGGGSSLAMSTLGNEADKITDDIQELARGLQNDPLKIFLYCRNNIEYEHYFGCKKGATLTLLEGKGNSFDISALMVAMLRAAGYTANYRYGLMHLPDSLLSEWLSIIPMTSLDEPFPQLDDATFRTLFGLTSDTRNTRILRFLIHRIIFFLDRGFPNTAFRTADDATFYYFPHVTVDVYEPIEGTNFTFRHNIDPSFKALKPLKNPRIDLKVATELSRTALLNDAGGSSGADYASNLNETAIASRLSTYTNNLLQWIRTNRDADSVAELVGRRESFEYSFDALADIPTPFYSNSYPWFPVETWTAIPTEWMSTLTVTIGQYDEGSSSFTNTYFTDTLTLPSLGGEKLSLSFMGNTANLRRDESLWSAVTISESSFDIEMAIDHPFGTIDTGTGLFTDNGNYDGSDVKEYQKNNTYAYALFYGYSPSGRLLRKRQEILDTYKRDGLTDNSHEVLTEILNVMGLTWLHNTEMSRQVILPYFDVVPLRFHNFGRMSQEGAFYITADLQHSGDASAYGNFDDSSVGAFALATHFDSALEHGVIEDLQGDTVEASSTIKQLQLANARGLRIYHADATNWTFVKAHLTTKGYSSAILATLEDFIDNEPGTRILLPEESTVPLGEWSGTAYASVGFSRIRMIIGGIYSGGYASETGAVTYDPINDWSYSDPSYWNMASSGLAIGYEPVTTPEYFGADPVAMATGSFIYTKDDLVIGKPMPRGLSFTRYYDSNRRFDKTPGLGFGWNHNLNIFVTERSATKAGLGGSTAYQMAPYLAAIAVAKELYINHTNAQEWLAAVLAIKWGVDQLHYKGVGINLGKKTLEFTQMPDGSYIAPAGITSTLSKSGNNYQLKERHGNTYNFNSNDLISSITDLHGKTLNITYNGNKINTVTDSYGRRLTFTWIGENITKVTDSTGRDVDFTYTGDDLTGATDPDNHTYTFSYDPEHRITELGDPKSRIITSNTYDTKSRVMQQRSQGDINRTWNFYYSGFCNVEQDPLGGNTSYLYDKRGRSSGIIDALGNRDIRIYDGQDRLKDYASRENFTDQGLYPISYFYDSNHNITMVIDELNNPRTNLYDSQNRLIEATDYRGNSVEYTYNATHQVLTVEDAENNIIQTNTYYTNGNLETNSDFENNTTTYHYDSYGNISQVDYPDGTSESFVNNPRGDLTSHTDPNRNTRTFTYNNRRQLLTETVPSVDGEAGSMINTYDSCGNLERVTDLNGNTVEYTYNALAQVLTTTQPERNGIAPISISEYDVRDWLSSVTDPLGNKTDFTYDAAHRRTAISDPLGHTVTQGFDEDGRRISLTDPENRETFFGYNPKGELLTTTDNLGHPIRNDYDLNSNQTSLTNRRNHTHSTTYDKNNRLLTSSTPRSWTTTQVWNERGLLESVEEPSGDRQVITYDTMERNSQIDVKQGATTISTITYGYDDNGNLIHTTEGTATLSRTYDARDRITSFTDVNGNTFGYDYDNNGNLTQLIYPGGTKVVTYTYNTHNQLETVTDWNSRVTSYQYDLNGRLIRVDKPNGTSYRASFDDAGRIKGISDISADDTPISYFLFSYDDSGLITDETFFPELQPYTLPSFTTTYDDDNRLTTIDGRFVTSDADGNLIYAPLFTVTPETLETYAYDSRNRLLSVDGVSYTYDSEGNRTAVTESSQTTTYAVDPNHPLSLNLVRTKADGSKTFYVYGMGLLYEVDEAENTKTYHYDYRGSTVALSEDDGISISDRIEYSPYGTITFRSGTTGTPFLYNGKLGVMTDSNGLLYMRARYYNPFLRRFVNPDPIGFAGGTNWYAYANNNPVTFTDPSGNCPSCVGAVSSVIIGGIIRGVTGGNIFDARSIATDAALGAIGVGVANKFNTVRQLSRVRNAPVPGKVLGEIGENLAGISSRGKTSIESLSRTATRRFPDAIDDLGNITEVKNVISISSRDARQIVDSVAFSTSKQGSTTLLTRGSATNISRVQHLVDNGLLNVGKIPRINSSGVANLSTRTSSLLGSGIGAVGNGIK